MNITTNHGKHRRSFWLGVGPVVVLLMLLALAVAPNASAEYGGARWGHADRAVCVQTKDIRSTAVHDAVKRSVSSWAANTVLDVRHRWDCRGYSQIVVVTARYYGSNGRYGWAEFKNGFDWSKVSTAGPWTVNGWTYTFRSPIAVRINLSSWFIKASSANRQYAVSHELGHALGLGHQYNTCKSVMVEASQQQACGVQYRYGGWWDWAGRLSNPGINQIYSAG